MNPVLPWIVSAQWSRSWWRLWFLHKFSCSGRESPAESAAQKEFTNLNCRRDLLNFVRSQQIDCVHSQVSTKCTTGRFIYLSIRSTWLCWIPFLLLESISQDVGLKCNVLGLVGRHRASGQVMVQTDSCLHVHVICHCLQDKIYFGVRSFLCLISWCKV